MGAHLGGGGGRKRRKSDAKKCISDITSRSVNMRYTD